MKAILCKQYGPPEGLVLEDLPALKAGKGQVVISVKAAGVNFPDTLIIQNKYQFKPELSFSPGSECAGVVKEVGEGVTAVQLGESVMALTTYGSFAEEITVKEAECAQQSPGGKSIVCLASKTRLKDGREVSNILPRHEAGTRITLPEHCVDWVVTEYGAVRLKFMNLEWRARSLIEIAHPQFRDELTRAAIENGLNFSGLSRLRPPPHQFYSKSLLSAFRDQTALEEPTSCSKSTPTTCPS